MSMLGLQEITGLFADCDYKYDVIMQERYNLYDFIGKVARDSRFNKGTIFYIRNGEKNRIAYYIEGHWGPLNSTDILRKCEVKKAKVKVHDNEFDFYCFIEFINDSADNTNVTVCENSSEHSITEMNLFSEDPEDNLTKPEWQLDRKALDFIHDAEATGSYLKQIDMIDTVDSLEFSKAIMKRLFQKLNRLRGHK